MNVFAGLWLALGPVVSQSQWVCALTDLPAGDRGVTPKITHIIPSQHSYMPVEVGVGWGGGENHCLTGAPDPKNSGWVLRHE